MSPNQKLILSQLLSFRKSSFSGNKTGQEFYAFVPFLYSIKPFSPFFFRKPLKKDTLAFLLTDNIAVFLLEQKKTIIKIKRGQISTL